MTKRQQGTCPGVAVGPRRADNRSLRAGFTLVEVLITISIVAILAGTVMFAMFSAQETAKVAKTKALVARLNNIVMAKYESYHTRRLSLEVNPMASTQAIARARVDALRDLMRMEMPDRWMDVIDAPIDNMVTGNKLVDPPLHRAYRARYDAVHAQNSANPSPKYVGAECLYLMVTLGHSDDGSERTAFPAGSIGDVDNDGMPEFLDAWGHPIAFLRWAPGFISDLQPEDAARRDSDQFDPTHVYPWTSSSPQQPEPTFALYPLIYSAGPDGLYDINDNQHLTAPHPAQTNNNPFVGLNDVANYPQGQSGTACDTTFYGLPKNGVNNWADNIHNHLLLTK